MTRLILFLCLLCLSCTCELKNNGHRVCYNANNQPLPPNRLSDSPITPRTIPDTNQEKQVFALRDTPKTVQPKTPSYDFLESNEATFYNRSWTLNKFKYGYLANNSPFFAAHRFLPFGTKILVVNNEIGSHYKKSIAVTVIDRGPLDLSYAAFKTIANPELGTVKVRVYKFAP